MLRRAAYVTAVLAALAALLCGSSDAQERARNTPDRQISFAPIDNVDRLVLFGCQDLEQVFRSGHPPTKELKAEGKIWRHYKYRGVGIGTEADEREIISVASAQISDLIKFELIPSSYARLAILRRVFGKPSKELPNELWYGSHAYATGIVRVKYNQQTAISIHWSC